MSLPFEVKDTITSVTTYIYDCDYMADSRGHYRLCTSALSFINCNTEFSG